MERKCVWILISVGPGIILRLGSLENIWALLGLRCLQSPLARLAIVSGAGGEGSEHWGVHYDKTGQ